MRTSEYTNPTRQQIIQLIQIAANERHNPAREINKASQAVTELKVESTLERLEKSVLALYDQRAFFKAFLLQEKGLSHYLESKGTQSTISYFNETLKALIGKNQKNIAAPLHKNFKEAFWGQYHEKEKYLQNGLLQGKPQRMIALLESKKGQALQKAIIDYANDPSIRHFSSTEMRVTKERGNLSRNMLETHFTHFDKIKESISEEESDDESIYDNTREAISFVNKAAFDEHDNHQMSWIQKGKCQANYSQQHGDHAIENIAANDATQFTIAKLGK